MTHVPIIVIAGQNPGITYRSLSLFFDPDAGKKTQNKRALKPQVNCHLCHTNQMFQRIG